MLYYCVHNTSYQVFIASFISFFSYFVLFYWSRLIFCFFFSVSSVHRADLCVSIMTNKDIQGGPAKVRPTYIFDANI